MKKPKTLPLIPGEKCRWPKCTKGAAVHRVSRKSWETYLCDAHDLQNEIAAKNAGGYSQVLPHPTWTLIPGLVEPLTPTE